MELLFLGTGNAFSESGDRPSCYLLKSETYNLLLDCGPSILPALYQNNVQPNDIDAIYISHLHPDHYFGLTYLFLDNYYVSRRGNPITIYGPMGTQDKLLKVLSVMYNQTEVDTFFDCFTVVEISSNQTVQLAQGMLQTLPAKHGAGGRMALVTLDNYKIGYSGDTEFSEEITRALLDTCDIVIHETTSAELHIPGHTNLFDLIDIDVPEDTHLFFSHHDQSVIDALEHVQLPSNKHLARDNMIVNVKELQETVLKAGLDQLCPICHK